MKSVTKSSAVKYWHENLVEKFKIFVQDFVTIKTGISLFIIEVVKAGFSACAHDVARAALAPCLS